MDGDGLVFSCLVASSKPIPIVPAFEPDDRQREAIEHAHGPMLVVAGAGTGKTTVLTRRIARLIQEGHARPDEILALTYADNAAEEMQERVRSAVGGNLKGLRVETFHAYCNNLLKACGKDFRVLDDQDLWIFLRRRIRELNLKHFVAAANLGKFLSDLLDFMRRCQDELVGPERYAEYVGRVTRGELPVPRVAKSKHQDELSDQEVIGRCQEISSVFTKVQQMLTAENLGTFGHMITHAHAVLTNDPELLARERPTTRFILVDEFQDANFAQLKILQKLAGDEQNVFAVGDPDQAIYRFRGASSAAFQIFQNAFPKARLVVLEKNRRSTIPILKAAHRVIQENPEVFAAQGGIHYRRQPLVSVRDEQALRDGAASPRPPVEAVLMTAKDVECSDVVNVIRDTHRRSRCKWSDFAVLYRFHSHREEVVDALAENSIPFTVENMDVMETSEARDLFACVGAVVSTADDAGLFRVAALPEFSIDPEQLRAGIRALPRNQEIGGVASVLTKIDHCPAVLEKLRSVREEIARNAAKGRAALEIVVHRFAFDSSSPPIAAVLNFVGNWESKPIVKTGEIGELLEYLDLFKEAGGTIPLPTPETDAVCLMTAHAAKGLEFKHVFILRANPPSFPSGFRESMVEFPRALRDSESCVDEDDATLHKQEERRLFYVAMTRAKDSLTIYARSGKGKDTTPSGFLREPLKDRTLTSYLHQRPGIGFQTDIFAQAAVVTPIAAWLAMPPAADLSARLSASTLQRYEVCPLQFKLEREWRIPGEVPAAMQYGGAMHRVLRAYFDSVRFERRMPEEAVLEMFRSELKEAKIQDRYQHDLYEQQGIDQLKAFVASCENAPCPEVLHTEEFFEIKVGESTVVGRIDRIDKLPDGSVVITDYKTGKAQSQDDADDSLQLSVYALAAREKWGYQARSRVLYNLGENTSAFTTRADSELQGAKLKIEEVAAKVAEGKFDPKTGYHCRFCAYQSLCPATEKRVYSIAEIKRNKSTRN